MARFNDLSISAFVALTLVILAAGHGNSQAGHATIRGTVADPDGSVFAGAFVTMSSGAKATFDGATGPDGRYSLQVPSGTYELSVNVPGMKPYKRQGLVLEAGQTVVADVRLEDGPSLRTLGEDPASIIARYFNRPDPPKGPTPKLRDRMPDLSGMWLNAPVTLNTEMLPWASALAKERAESHSKDYPPGYCLPSGPVPLLDGGFFQLVHHQKTLLMLFESDTPGYRQVFIDGRKPPKTAESLWLGYSVGRWQRDTLVIDTVGFKDRGWLNFEGHPHSDKMRVTHRLRRPDLGHLEIEIAIDDRGTFQKPWTTKTTATLAPDEEVREYICNENNKAPVHLVGK